MTKKLPRFAALMVAITFIVSVFNSTILAQKTVDSSVIMERERMSRIMHPAGNIEEFRREYYNYLSELESVTRLLNEVPAVREKFNRSGLRPIERLVEAKHSVAEASIEDLTLLRTAYAKAPNWRETPYAINSLIKPELRQQLQASLYSKENGGIGLDGIPDNCQDGINAGITNTDISIAQGVALAASALMEGFPTDGVTIAARIAPIAAWAVAEGAVIALETLKAIKDDCQSSDFEESVKQQITDTKNTIVNNNNSNRDLILNNDDSNKDIILNNLETAKTTIVNNDNSNKTEIISNDNSNTTNIINNDNTNRLAIISNDNSNKDTIINNDNTNKTEIINNDNANTVTITTAVDDARSQVIVNANANKDEMLRLMIHADLASVDSATSVAVFMLPAAQNGYLELVRTIVVQMITDLAGSSTAQANSFLAEGDAFKDAGNYKSAYASYRKAYKAAAR